MSVVYRGTVLDTELSKGAMGGTEMMRSRFLSHVDKDLMRQVAVHFSRPVRFYSDVPNILYLHDLAGDPATAILFTEQGRNAFDKFVFVSHWQKTEFIKKYGLDTSKCVVIENAIEKQFMHSKTRPITKNDPIRFIYHTTPHRGLELLVPIIDALKADYPNIHLDVFSSFAIYGWTNRDVHYSHVFDAIEQSPNMTYHGTKSNSVILDALDSTDVFLYPCIWPETSCIALIEALLSGCMCVYPDLGALKETGSMGDKNFIYEHSSDVNTHANTAYRTMKSILNRGYIQSNITASSDILNKYHITDYAMNWNRTMESVLNGRQ